MSGPDRIYLQDAGDYASAAEFEVTWCVDPQDDGDTEYIRRDPAVLAALEVQPITVQDAARVPEIAALLVLMAEVVPSLEATKHNISLCNDLAAALRAIAEGRA